MWVIGIAGDCEHGSAVALIEQGELVYAEAEERLSRIKCDGAFPHRALERAMRRVGSASPNVVFAAPGRPMLSTILQGWTGLGDLASALRQRAWFELELLAAARRWGVGVERVDHHKAHARCAAYCADLSDGLVVTADGQGDEVTAAVWMLRQGVLERIWHNTLKDGSLGFFFAAITEHLGYRRLQDEGKVTALSATGVRRPQLVEVMKRIVSLKESPNGPVLHLDPTAVGDWSSDRPLLMPALARELQAFDAADIALAAQERLEQVMAELLAEWIDKGGHDTVAVAGGLFANVGLNRRLGGLAVHRFLVAPPMGDEGLAIGAAAEVALRHAVALRRCPPMFLGTEVGANDATQAVGRFPEWISHSAEARTITNLSALLLAQGEVVARCAGAAEFGPRALGNRSLLYRPDDASCREWLNRNLGRDAIMPFAPCVRREDLHDVTNEDADRFGGLEAMTVAISVTADFRKRCPAVVHADGTARIQVVVRDRSPELWAILTSFGALTGLPALLNTSLNRHGDPICCTLEESLVCSSASSIDFVLAAPTVLLHRSTRIDVVQHLSALASSDAT